MQTKDLYIIFGPPGSGKTTLAGYMAKVMKLNHISWGNIKRDALLKKEYEDLLKVVNDPDISDKLRSKKVAFIIGKEVVKISKRSKGLLLDGFPKRVEESKLLLDIIQKYGFKIKALIRINPSVQRAYSRFTNRYVCKICGRHYDLDLNPPSVKGICDYDGGEIIRQAASQASIKRMFDTYMKVNLPAFEYLKPYAKTYFGVSGEDEDIVVFSKVLMKLENSEKDDYSIYKRKSASILDTKYGQFTIIAYQSDVDYTCHLALVKGNVQNGRNIAVRVHSSCITGDIFGSKKCDCGDQLHKSLRQINKQGRGVVLYLFQEGRGINIINKIEAYRLQRMGLDTVEANEKLGLPPEMRQYTPVKDILEDLKVRSICLLTNNPDKVKKLTDLGVMIESTRSLEIKPCEENRRYLRTKKEKMLHNLNKV